jgi:hypothetical protein
MRQFSFILSGLALVLSAAALTHSLRSDDRFDFDFDIPQVAQAPGFYPLPAGPTGICPAGACAAAASPPTAYGEPVDNAAVSAPGVLECSSKAEEDSECATERIGIDLDCSGGCCVACDETIDDNIHMFEQLLRLELETADSPNSKYVDLHKAVVKCLDSTKLDEVASLLEELAQESAGTPEGERAAAALAQLKGTLPTPRQPLKSEPEPQPLKSCPDND